MVLRLKKHLRYQYSLLQQILICVSASLIVVVIAISILEDRYTKYYDRIVTNDIDRSLEIIQENIISTEEQFWKIAQMVRGNSVSVRKGYALFSDYQEYLHSEKKWSGEEVAIFVKSYHEYNELLSQITTLNPNIGNYALLADKGNDADFILSNKSIYTDFDMDRMHSLPALTQKPNYVFYLPHKSFFSDSDVLSCMIELDEKNKIYLYMETKGNFTRRLEEELEYKWQIYFVTGNQEGKIVYSSPSKPNLDGTTIQGLEEAKNHIFKISSSQPESFSFMGIMSHSDYRKVFDRWNSEYLGIFLFVFPLSYLLNLLSYQIIYRKIRRVTGIMGEMPAETDTIRKEYLGIKELDLILDAFYDACIKNIELLKQIGEKEKQERQLEYEKLLIQINPHFIQNTLNSIQWMARLNHQDDIQHMVCCLVRVFQYNLQANLISNLQAEIATVQAYMDLQIMRYGEKLKFRYEIDHGDYNLPIPRFLLQPLLENAILHGADENGNNEIVMKIYRDSNTSYIISIHDKGRGFSQELKERILKRDTAEKSGMGIGLRYVIHALAQNNGSITKIENHKNGTEICMRISMGREGIKEEGGEGEEGEGEGGGEGGGEGEGGEED